MPLGASIEDERIAVHTVSHAPPGASQTLVLHVPSVARDGSRFENVLRPDATSISHFANTNIARVYRDLLYFILDTVQKEAAKSRVVSRKPFQLVLERIDTYAQTRKPGLVSDDSANNCRGRRARCPDWRLHVHNYDSRMSFENMFATAIENNNRFWLERTSKARAGGAGGTITVQEVSKSLHPTEGFRRIRSMLIFFMMCDLYTGVQNVYTNSAESHLPRVETGRPSAFEGPDTDPAGGGECTFHSYGEASNENLQRAHANAAHGDDGSTRLVETVMPSQTTVLCRIFSIEHAIELSHGAVDPLQKVPRNYTEGAHDVNYDQRAAQRRAAHAGGSAGDLYQEDGAEAELDAMDADDDDHGDIDAGDDAQNQRDSLTRLNELLGEEHADDLGEGFRPSQAARDDESEGGGSENDSMMGPSRGRKRGRNDAGPALGASAPANASWFYPVPQCAYDIHMQPLSTLCAQRLPGMEDVSAHHVLGMSEWLRARRRVEGINPDFVDTTNHEAREAAQRRMDRVLRTGLQRARRAAERDKFTGCMSADERMRADDERIAEEHLMEARMGRLEESMEKMLVDAGVRLVRAGDPEAGAHPGAVLATQWFPDPAQGGTRARDDRVRTRALREKVNTGLLRNALADTLVEDTLRGTSNKMSDFGDINATDGFGRYCVGNALAEDDLREQLRRGAIAYLPYAHAMRMLREKGIEDTERCWCSPEDMPRGLAAASRHLQAVIRERHSVSFLLEPIDFGSDERGGRHTFFANWMGHLYIGMGRAGKLVNAHPGMVKMYVGSMDSTRNEPGLHIHFIESGPSAAAKSHKHEMMKEVTPEGVTNGFSRKTKCADQGNEHVTGTVETTGELNAFEWVRFPNGRKQGDTNAVESTGDEFLKDLLSLGLMLLKVMRINPDTGEREFQGIFCKWYTTQMYATNIAPSDIAPAMAERVHTLTATLPVRSDGITSISDLKFTYAALEGSSTHLVRDFKLYAQTLWAMVALANTTIHLRGLPRPNMDVFNSTLSCVRRELASLGVKKFLTRTTERMQAYARTLTIMNAVQYVYNSEVARWTNAETGEFRGLREGSPHFEYASLIRMRRKLVCDRQVAAWAIHSFGTEWVPEHFGSFVVALAKQLNYLAHGGENLPRRFARRWNEQMGAAEDDPLYLRFDGTRMQLARELNRRFLPEFSENDVYSMVSSLEKRMFSAYARDTQDLRSRIDTESRVEVVGLREGTIAPEGHGGGGADGGGMHSARPYTDIAVGVFEMVFGDQVWMRVGDRAHVLEVGEQAALAAKNGVLAEMGLAPVTTLGDGDGTECVDADNMVVQMPFVHRSIKTMHPQDLLTIAILRVLRHKYARRGKIALPVPVRKGEGYIAALFTMHSVYPCDDYVQEFPNVEVMTDEVAAVLPLNQPSKRARTAPPAPQQRTVDTNWDFDADDDDDDNARDGAWGLGPAPAESSDDEDDIRGADRDRYKFKPTANIIQMTCDEDLLAYRQHCFDEGLSGPLDHEDEADALADGYTRAELHAVRYDKSAFSPCSDEYIRVLYQKRTGNAATDREYPESFTSMNVGTTKQSTSDVHNTSAGMKRLLSIDEDSSDTWLDEAMGGASGNRLAGYPNATAGLATSFSNVTVGAGPPLPRRAHTAPAGTSSRVRSRGKEPASRTASLDMWGDDTMATTTGGGGMSRCGSGSLHAGTHSTRS